MNFNALVVSLERSRSRGKYMAWQKFEGIMQPVHSNFIVAEATLSHALHLQYFKRLRKRELQLPYPLSVPGLQVCSLSL